MSLTYTHLPVLLNPVLAFLEPERGGVYLDGTVGLGGHAKAILERAKAAPSFRYIGLDQDAQALAMATTSLTDKRVELLQANAADMEKVCQQLKITSLQGVLLDLGISSYQLDDPERGFSFLRSGPLDMRMDAQHTVTAATILNTWPEPRLADLFWRYGEERYSRKIAHRIVERRHAQPFLRTDNLADLVVSAYPPAARYRGIHPATRVFQALRIEVNQELAALERAITAALPLLALPGGRLLIISFHSLEDRIVKHRFRQAVQAGGYQLLNKKPVIADEEEEKQNPRARSAKLRVIERI